MSPTMYWSRASKSFHPDSLKSRVSFDLAAASPLFLRNSSELVRVRPIRRASNCGFMQPSHARLYRPGISFRFVRSPEAPKIIRTHESPVGSGSCDNFSRGLAWIIADIIFMSIDVLDMDFESYPETNLFRRVLSGISGYRLAEALSEPIGYELPRLVRLVGLDMLGAPLSHSENSQLFIGRAGRRVSFAGVVQRNGQIVFAVQDKKWLLQPGQDVGQRPLLDALESLFHRFGAHDPRKLKEGHGDTFGSSSPAFLPHHTIIPDRAPGDARLDPSFECSGTGRVMAQADAQNSNTGGIDVRTRLQIVDNGSRGNLVIGSRCDVTKPQRLSHAWRIDH